MSEVLFNTGDVNLEFEPISELKEQFGQKYGESSEANAFWAALNEIATHWYHHAHLRGGELPPSQHSASLDRLASSIARLQSAVGKLPALSWYDADMSMRIADFPSLDKALEPLEYLKRWARDSAEMVKDGVPSKSASITWLFSETVDAHWTAFGRLPSPWKGATGEDFHGLMVALAAQLEISNAGEVEGHIKAAIKSYGQRNSAK